MIIAVIDTETAGRNGYPYDLVVDIGVSLVDTENHLVKPYYSAIVGYDVKTWSDRLKSEWIFTHKGATLTLDDVAKATPSKKVADDLRLLLGEFPVTSYNMAFDFDKFLNHPPWNLQNHEKVLDIMLVADTIDEIPRSLFDAATGWRSWPKLDVAYKTLCPDNPAHIEDQDHRALSDTIVAGHVLLAMVKRGIYPREPRIYTENGRYL